MSEWWRKKKGRPADDCGEKKRRRKGEGKTGVETKENAKRVKGTVGRETTPAWEIF